LQIVIPAAGKGTRLGNLTKANTKGMLEVNGENLISRALKNISYLDVSKIIIIIGYEGENLKKYIGDNYNGIPISYVWNKEYETTNNIYSIFLAKNEIIKDDSIFIESDLIFDKNLLKDLVDCPHENLVVGDHFETWMDGTVIVADNNLNISSFVSKNDIDMFDISKYYKTVNIYKFSKKFLEDIYFPLISMYINAGSLSEYYETPLKLVPLIKFDGLKIFNANSYDWYEIDDIQDLDMASLLFSEPSKSYELTAKRYGGYWRFPDVLDYCYLVNPHFPSKQMKDELASNFNDLIGSYPSALHIQNMLASRLFNIDPEYVVVGNGGTELINEMGRFFECKFHILTPTFKEYEKRFKNIAQKEVTQENISEASKDFLINHNGTDGLIIVNPDNPTGQFIEKKEMIEFIEDNKEIPIIVDESFMDFVDLDYKYTLIDQDLMKKYKNLFVLKSIGKSYGVGGLRLGVLISGDIDSIKTIGNNLPIWNINSVSENFLQIVQKYKSEFIKSCEQISQERNFLFKQLEKISYIEPLPSQANYIFCKVVGKDAKDLCTEMYAKHNIFIKLYDHKNFPNYIRISVRSGEDNSLLINALLTIN